MTDASSVIGKLLPKKFTYKPLELKDDNLSSRTKEVWEELNSRIRVNNPKEIIAYVRY